jgi:hypothetical protein
MPLLELDEDALKIIARKVCSVDIRQAKKGTNSVMRLLMPSLCMLHRLCHAPVDAESVHLL